MSFWFWKVWKRREKLQKIDYLEHIKELFRWNKKHFSWFLKGYYYVKNNSRHKLEACKSHITWLDSSKKIVSHHLIFPRRDRKCKYRILYVIFSIGRAIVFWVIWKAVTNTPVPVTKNANIKVLVDLKLQLRRCTNTLIFYLNICDASDDSFFMYRIEINVSVWNFFSNLTNIYFLPVLSLQIGWQYTGNTFLGLEVPVFKTVPKLQTNLMIVYQ